MSNEVADKRSKTLDPKLGSMLEIGQPNDKNFIFCGTCSHVIGHAGDAITHNGAHAHVLTNPHGFVFNVGCFANALGCEISGAPEAADSWFMGFVWQVASCAECHSHLGWYFSQAQGQTYFYGLILDRIQQEK